MADYKHGEMETGYQRQLFVGFLKFILRTCILIAIILAFMAAFLT